MTRLEECVSGALDHMVKHAEQVKANSAQQRTVHGFMRNSEQSTSAIDYRNATTAVQRKYTETEKALLTYQPYHPMSLTYFEPVNSSERYHWLRGLELSVPTALLKEHIGGSIGILAWLVRRDPEKMNTVGDEQELEEARAMIKPVLPQVRYL